MTMKITGKSFEQIRPAVQQPAAKVQDQAEQTSGAQRPARNDSVQISDAARALAGGEAAGGPLTPERTAELRRKVLEGAYNSLNVVDHVAKRIIERGDV
jgi:anti-sigma28 factor (negative regulator of flagellin synthesis)